MGGYAFFKIVGGLALLGLLWKMFSLGRTWVEGASDSEGWKAENVCQLLESLEKLSDTTCQGNGSCVRTVLQSVRMHVGDFRDERGLTMVQQMDNAIEEGDLDQFRLYAQMLIKQYKQQKLQCEGHE